tara:strand:- start:3738 stop:4388 length:651 start_codon:yes stop_codon:yes gene_type:complete
MMMAEYTMTFIFSNSGQRAINPDNQGEVEVIAIENIPAERMFEYTPFAFWFCVDEKTTETGFTVKKIEGDSQSVTVEGFVKKGIIPMPVTKVFSVGDTFTADGMFSVSSDGSPVLGGSVEITEIINCKSKTDLEAVLNKFSAFDTIFEKKIKYAESSDPNTSEYDPYGFTPAGAQAADNLMKAESYEDFFGEEYQAFMAEYAMSIIPPHYHYEANV